MRATGLRCPVACAGSCVFVEASFRVVGFFSNFLDIQKAGKKNQSPFIATTPPAQSGIVFGFMEFLLRWEMRLFFLRESFFCSARQREKKIGVFVFVFLGCVLCFLVFFCFSRVSAKFFWFFFRRWHEQNREFPLCVVRRTAAIRHRRWPMALLLLLLLVLRILPFLLRLRLRLSTDVSALSFGVQ